MPDSDNKKDKLGIILVSSIIGGTLAYFISKSKNKSKDSGNDQNRPDNHSTNPACEARGGKHERDIAIKQTQNARDEEQRWQRIIEKTMSRKKKWDDSDTTDKANVILNSCIAAFTLIIAAVAVAQIAMYSDAVRVENRAYAIVPPDSITLTNVKAWGDGEPARFELDKPIEGYFFIGNLGKTPTRELRIYADLIDLPKMTDPRPPDIVSDTLTPLIVGAGLLNRLPIETKYVLTPERVVAIGHGENVLYLLGKMTYKDVLGDEHYTRFCFYYVIKHGRFYAYRKYNDAD